MEQRQPNQKEDMVLIKYWNQTIDVECPKCTTKNNVLTFKAWLENEVCTSCKTELFNQSRRQALLPEKMVLDIALVVRSLHLMGTNFNENTRQIILDLNCAMEVVLKRKIESYMFSRKVDNELIDYVLERIERGEQIMKLVKTFKFKHPETAKNKYDKIRNLRNKVAHSGYTPSLQETKDGTQDIFDIITQIEPPSPPWEKLRELARVK